MNTLKQRSIHTGDKVSHDTTTQDRGNVRLGDAAPIFVRPVRSGDNVVRDNATKDKGLVRLGDAAPVFKK